MLGASGCLSLLLLGAPTLEAAVGAEGEVAAGRAPVGLQGRERNSLALTGIPALGLRLHSFSENFTATYQPRIFYRLPNPLNVKHPLLLHQFGLGYDKLLTRSTQWLAHARLDIGEVDYTSASLVFDPQAAGLRQDVAKLARLNGDTTLRSGLSARTTLSLTLQGDYTTPIGDQPAPAADPDAMLPDVLPGDALAAAGSGIEKSASGTLRPELRHALTPRDALLSSLRLTYQWFSTGGRFILISPQVGWERRFSARTTLTSSVGPLYVVTLEAAPGNPEDNVVAGAGLLEVTSVLDSSGGRELTGQVGASVEWFFDPLSGTSAPRAEVHTSLVARIGRDWQFSPNASFSTLLRDSGGGAAGVTTSLDGSVLLADLPVRYRLTPHAGLNFGFRGSLRGGRLGSSDFSLNDQVEAWVYVGLSVAITSGGDEAPWLVAAVPEQRSRATSGAAGEGELLSPEASEQGARPPREPAPATGR